MVVEGRRCVVGRCVGTVVCGVVRVWHEVWWEVGVCGVVVQVGTRVVGVVCVGSVCP